MRITCDDGAAGVGYTYTIGTGGSSVVALSRDHLAPRLVGRDPECIEAIWKDLFFHTHATAVGAITSLALAAIDTALWDLRCRAHGLPLWKAAGGAQPKVPVYTTEGGWLHLSRASSWSSRPSRRRRRDSAARRSRWAGRTSSEDVARLAAVREAVGDAFEIMVDANQCFTVAEAIRRAQRVRAVRPRLARGAAAGRGSRRPRRARGAHVHSDRRRRIALPPRAFPRISRARRVLDRAGRRRAHRRHHAVAQGRRISRRLSTCRSARIS